MQKVWATDFKSHFRCLLSSIAFVWTTEFFWINQVIQAFLKILWLSNIFLKFVFEVIFFFFFFQINLYDLLRALLFNLWCFHFLNNLSCRAMLSRTSPSNHSCELLLTRLVLKSANLSITLINFWMKFHKLYSRHWSFHKLESVLYSEPLCRPQHYNF